MKLHHFFLLMFIYFCGAGYVAFKVGNDDSIMIILIWSWFLLFYNNILQLILPNVIEYTEEEKKQGNENNPVN